ncbi:MAG: hypothetical protein ACFB5Z_09130 [Elainellaceae cyanobacterium]
MLNKLEQPLDWLILGDSSCNQGVVPEVLSEELGGTALNLCIFGPLLVFNDAWMLEQHIRQVGPPKNVVIIHVYDLWDREVSSETFAHLSRTPLSQKEIRAFTPPLSPDFGQKLQWFSYKHLHLYTSSKTLADFLQKPAKTFKKGREFTVSPSGFMPKYSPNPESVVEDAVGHRGDIRGETPKISDINQRSLAAIRSLADRYEFEVYIVASPLYDELYEDPKFRRYLRRTEQMLEQETRSSDRLHVLMDDPVTFGADEMENADHVIESAAKVYTGQIAAQIAAQAQRAYPAEPE